ncbi:MAG: transglutaminase-like domain-containing protein [Candidatus Dojkabacteria bacterium]|nr:transglutaminase-like domain-containing protein [Candidatus Dojkabacteria bacterium]
MNQILKLEKIQKTLDSIKITNEVGTDLQFSYEETESNNLIIKVPFTDDITYGDPQVITLKYKSYGLVVQSGAVFDVYIPGFPEGYDLSDGNTSETINTKVIIPNEMPELNLSIPKLDVTSLSNGDKSIDIDFDKLKGDTVWLQIGSEQFYEFVIKQEVPKTTNAPIVLNTVDLILPRDIDSGPISQRVYYEEINPEPYSIKEDSDGNLIAEFKLTANRNQEIYIKGYATQRQDPNFNINEATTILDIPTSLINKYTEPAEYWEVNDPQIMSTALDLKGTKTNTGEIVNQTYNFVVDRIDYSFVKKYGINERQGAKATLNGGAAVCMEYADLFITLMRAQGIPARAAYGYGYSSLDFESRSENRINHQWAEVYLPGLDTWINVDTTWGDFGTTLVGGDLNHFYSHVSSIDPNTPSLLQTSYFGNIGDIPEREMDIKLLRDVEIKASFDSSDELLRKYKEKEGINIITGNVSLYANNFNEQLNIVLIDRAGLTTTGAMIVKLAVLFIILSPILYSLGKKILRIFFKENSK